MKKDNKKKIKFKLGNNLTIWVMIVIASFYLVQLLPNSLSTNEVNYNQYRSYLVNGEIKIGDIEHKKLNGSNLILLSKGQKLKVKGITKAKFLLISGKPINEQIARGGPFVMNTKSEILEAVNDFHNGTFVK